MKLIGFLCNWCSYAGADLAGVSRFKYPSDMRAVRVMCTGRLDPYFVLRAFEKGADGVLVAGCHIGDCHYIDGNVTAVERMERLKQALPMLGIDPRRFRFEFVSASEGRKFQQVVTEFTRQIAELCKEPGKGEAQSLHKDEAQDSPKDKSQSPHKDEAQNPRKDEAQGPHKDKTDAGRERRDVVKA